MLKTWNKLHFLLPTPGVTSITQYRALQALSWVSLGVVAARPPSGREARDPVHTFQQHVLATPPDS